MTSKRYIQDTTRAVRAVALSLADYLPINRQGSILFTTRNRQVAVKHADLNVVTLKEMTRSESLKLLQRSLSDKTPGTERDAAELLKLLIYLALAIK